MDNRGWWIIERGGKSRATEWRESVLMVLMADSESGGKFPIMAWNWRYNENRLSGPPLDQSRVVPISGQSPLEFVTSSCFWRERQKVKFGQIPIRENWFKKLVRESRNEVVNTWRIYYLMNTWRSCRNPKISENSEKVMAVLCSYSEIWPHLSIGSSYVIAFQQGCIFRQRRRIPRSKKEACSNMSVNCQGKIKQFEG